MKIEMVKTSGLAHLSYFFASDAEAFVVDPRRDIEVYLDLSRKNGTLIRHVFETHRNEDLVSGAPLLAEATGADVWHGPNSERNIEYAKTTREGDEFYVGSARICVLETPGHTDDSLSFILYDKDYDQGPVGVFTGDALFVGDVGRTDFYPDRKKDVAGLLYDSLQKLISLGDQCLIYPAHGAGSVCGSAMADREFSSIGHERANNSRLRISDRDAFIDAKIAEQHYIPPYFQYMEQINMDGANPPPSKLLPFSLKAVLNQNERLCLDVRGIFDFAGGHIPGSLCIPHDMLASFGGWFLKPDTPILIVARTRQQALESAASLNRIGIDEISGYATGVMPVAIQSAPLGHLDFVQTETIESRQSSADSTWTLLDVRGIEEFNTAHIDGAKHAYVGTLPESVEDLSKDAPLTVMCGSGARATIAASQLIRSGWKTVDVYIGSMQAWTAAGKPTVN